MAEKKKIICVIPAYNEEKSIRDVIKAVKGQADEVVVVNDCSKDRTREIATSEGATVLNHIINRDQGAALETGNKYALSQGADVIYHFDADGQHKADEIQDVLAPILKGRADIVFGSRFLNKKSEVPFIKNYILFPLAKIVNRLLLGVSFSDPQCGFRAMSREAASQLRIEQDGKAHCSEILYKTHKLGLRAVEVPVTVIYNNFGLKFIDGVRIIKDIIFYKLLN